jgi:membrane protease YdiL (CAAX protease family)
MTLSDDSNGFTGVPPSSDPLSLEPPPRPAFSEVPPGDPFTYGAAHPQPYKFTPPPPADLEVPWSWGHLLSFAGFGFFALLFVQVIFIAYYVHAKAISAHPTQREFQQFALTKPVFAIGSMVLWYALLLFFLYVTLTFFYRTPFWQSLGWRRLSRENQKAPAKPWIYFFMGCGLSVLVMLVTVTVKAPEHAPIQDLLKNRNMAFAFMGMAVLIAPLVEETIFRGYLFPLLARWLGMMPGIVLTGILFGLMHGYQLGWAWKLVATLIGVGIIFTIVRSRAESTFASFLMHLGYNSVIAFIGTLGLIFAKYAKLPPPHP